MRWTQTVMLVGLWVGTLTGSLAFAQAPPGGGGESASNYEFGFHLGNLLPNQIAGVPEITGLGGIRGGARMSPTSFFEAGFITGNGGGVEWKNLHVDLRMDIQVENLTALAYFGGDAVYYNGVDQGNRLIFGGHVGGGLQTEVSGNTLFRGDMKFGLSPGTSLYVGFGFVFRI